MSIGTDRGPGERAGRPDGVGTMSTAATDRGTRAPESDSLRAPWWILALVAALLVPGVWWGMPSEFSAAIDAPGPYSPLAFVAEYGNPSLAGIYPATHQLVLLLSYGLVLLGLLVTGGLDLGALSGAWPHGFADPVAAFTALIVAGRTVSVIMGVWILASLWRLRFPGWTRGAALAATALLAGSGIFAYYSRTTNVDIPYLFWWVLSFVALWRYALGDGRTRHIIIAGVLAGLAVGSKTQAAGLVLGSGLIVLLVGRAGSRLPERVRHAAVLTAALIASYAVFAILPQPARWLYHVRNYTLTNRSVAESVDQVELTFSAGASLVHVLSLAGIALAVLGVVYLARERRWRLLGVLLLPAASYYALIVAATGFVPSRFMLPVGWLLAVPAGYGVVRTAGFLGRGQRAVWVVIVVLAVARQFATGYLPVTWAQTESMKNRLAHEIGEVVPPGSTIHWMGPRPHLPDARVYTDYRLVHSPGEKAWTRSSEHAVAEIGEEAPRYVLAAEPLAANADAVLVRSWTYADWVRDSVRMRVIHEFHLYETVESVRERAEGAAGAGLSGETVGTGPSSSLGGADVSGDPTGTGSSGGPS